MHAACDKVRHSGFVFPKRHRCVCGSAATRLRRILIEVHKKTERLIQLRGRLYLLQHGSFQCQ
jgi:hypothetical protein